MNGADWVILGLILLSAAMAAAQGFFFEVISMAGLVVGYVLAAWQYWRVAAWFAPHVKSPWLAEIAGFLIILIGVMILAGVLGRILRWLMKEVGLRWFDRLLGAAFGLIRGCLLVSVLLLGVTTFAPDAQWLQGSSLAPYFVVVARAASWVAPSEIRARFRQGAEALSKVHHPSLGTSTAGTPAH